MRKFGLAFTALAVLVGLEASTAQQAAYTAEGSRIYLFEDGSWSANSERSMDTLFEVTMQDRWQSDTTPERCTLVFGLSNLDTRDFRLVQLDLQILNSRDDYLRTRRVAFKHPRSGQERFTEVRVETPTGCEGVGDFDVVDAPRCERLSGEVLENCFGAVRLAHLGSE